MARQLAKSDKSNYNTGEACPGMRDLPKAGKH